MPLPLDKPYRAFRELDGLSDRQGRRLVAMAARRHRVSMAFAIAGGLLATAGGWAAMASIWRVVAAVLPREWGESVAQRDMGPGIWIMLLSLSIAAGPLCGLLVRDRWQRWAIRKHLERTRCSCGRALVGQAAGADGTVVCPRCGAAVGLGERGLTADDLRPAG